MRKFIIAVAALSFSASSFASTASANHGHHGGGNNGAMGAAAGAFGGGSSAAGSAGSGQSGMGGSYWAPNLNADPVDAYQPWPQSQIRAPLILGWRGLGEQLGLAIARLAAAEIIGDDGRP
jgi:hypothetical protein